MCHKIATILVSFLLLATVAHPATIPSPSTPLVRLAWVEVPDTVARNQSLSVAVRLTEALSGKPTGGPVKITLGDSGYGTVTYIGWADYTTGICRLTIAASGMTKNAIMLECYFEGDYRAFCTSSPISVRLR